jgi:hypothetical protein
MKFCNNLNKYKEEFYNDAKYYLLIDTITYLQKLTDKIEKEKSDVKKYLELSKIYIEPN